MIQSVWKLRSVSEALFVFVIFALCLFVCLFVCLFEFSFGKMFGFFCCLLIALVKLYVIYYKLTNNIHDRMVVGFTTTYAVSAYHH